MCGGPALLGDNDLSQNTAIGMVEARVAINPAAAAKTDVESEAREQLQELDGHTLVMPSQEILKFVAKVEAEMISQES